MLWSQIKFGLKLHLSGSIGSSGSKTNSHPHLRMRIFVDFIFLGGNFCALFVEENPTPPTSPAPRTPYPWLKKNYVSVRAWCWNSFFTSLSLIFHLFLPLPLNPLAPWNGYESRGQSSSSTAHNDWPDR